MTKKELTKVQEYLNEQLDTIALCKANECYSRATEYIVQGVCNTLLICGYDVIKQDNGKVKIVKF